MSGAGLTLRFSEPNVTVTRAADAAAVAQKTFDAEINGFDAAVNKNSKDRQGDSHNNVYVVVVPKPLERLLCVVYFGKSLG